MQQLTADTSDTIRILHVDDEPAFTELTATFLSRQNDRFTIESATSASEGLEYLSEHDVDCVLSDYDMPGRDGIAFLEAVREEYPDLPFILYTGKGSEEVASDAISAGVSDYLQKDSGSDHYTILSNRISNLVAQTRAEFEVERTREYFSRILNHASDYVLIVDGDGRVQYVSPSVERVMGYPPDELAEMDAFETIHPEDLDLAAGAFTDLISNPEEERTVEYRARHADGSWRWLEVRGRNLLDDPVIDGILVNVRDITERKAHEQELTRVQRRFEAVLENTTTPMFMKAADGTYIFVNEEYRDLFDLQDDEIIGRTDADLHPPEVAADVQRNDEIVLERGEPIETEERVLVGEEERVFLTTKVPIYDTGERSDPDDPVGVFGVATDITERKRQERRLDTLISNLPGIVYRSRNDPDWPMDLVRGECEELTGYSAEAIEAGEVIWGEDLLHPDDAPRIWTAVQEAIAEDRPFEVTYRIRTKDGDVKWMWERGRVIEVGPQDEMVVEGFITDITARKDREEELTRIERRYHAVFEDPNILVGLLDTDGTVLDINRTAMEYVDATRDSLTGTPFWSTPWFEHSNALQADIRAWVDRAAAGEYVEFEADLQRPDGDPYNVEGVFRPVRDEEGEVVSLLVSDRDITERKNRERELERIHDFFTEAERLGDLGAWEVTADGEVTWTEGTRRIHEVDETYDPTIQDGIAFYHPDDRERIERAVEAALEEGEPYEVVARLITAEDNERWIRTRGKPLGDGETIRGFIQDITERKERELELDRQLDLFRKAEDLAKVGAWEYDIQAGEGWWSDQVSRIHGLPIDIAPTPEMSLDHYHPEDRPRVEAAFERAIEDGEPYDLELRLIDANGEQKWVRTRGDPEVEAGEPVLIRGTIQDITDRKDREERLRETTARLEALFEHSPDMIDVLDAEGRIRDVNRRFHEELGYEADQLIGRPIWEIDRRVDEDDVRALLSDFELDERRRVEGVYERRDGTTFPVEVHLLRLAVDGEDRFVAISRDISERKTFEAKITGLHNATHDIFSADSQEEVADIVIQAMRDLLEMPINGVALHNPEESVLRTIASSDRSEALLGANPVFGPGESLAWEAFETGETRHYDDVSTVPGRANSDTPIRSEIIVPLGDHGVVLIGSTEIGVFDDTDVSLAETLGAHAETALDRIARERALHQQNDRLEEFASVVSHDLRNPLNVAMGRLALAQEECASEHLDEVRDALDRSETLIDDLLTLAREGERVRDVESVDLGAITADCWEHVATERATIEIVTDRTIRADRSRLQQLLENLYRNAIEHASDDVTVTVGELPNGFYVEDDGPGIPADERDSVFDVGYSRATDGTGFGLSIVQQIADAHGWSVRITDGDTDGTRVEITGVEVES